MAVCSGLPWMSGGMRKNRNVACMLMPHDAAFRVQTGHSRCHPTVCSAQVNLGRVMSCSKIGHSYCNMREFGKRQRARIFHVSFDAEVREVGSVVWPWMRMVHAAGSENAANKRHAYAVMALGTTATFRVRVLCRIGTACRHRRSGENLGDVDV